MARLSQVIPEAIVVPDIKVFGNTVMKSLVLLSRILWRQFLFKSKKETFFIFQ